MKLEPIKRLFSIADVDDVRSLYWNAAVKGDLEILK